MTEQLAALFKILGARSIDEAIKKAECYDVWNKLDVKKIKELTEEVRLLKEKLLDPVRIRMKHANDVNERYEDLMRAKLEATGHVFSSREEFHKFAARKLNKVQQDGFLDFEIHYEGNPILSAVHSKIKIENAEGGFTYTYNVEVR